MLKVMYTETGQYLEHVSTSLSSWLARQHHLAKQTGYDVHIETCTASILLPDQPDWIAALQSIQRQDGAPPFHWNRADAEMIEVMLPGVWMTSHPDSEEGAFLADLGDRTVMTLVHLWALTMAPISPIKGSI